MLSVIQIIIYLPVNSFMSLPMFIVIIGTFNTIVFFYLQKQKKIVLKIMFFGAESKVYFKSFFYVTVLQTLFIIIYIILYNHRTRVLYHDPKWVEDISYGFLSHVLYT